MLEPSYFASGIGCVGVCWVGGEVAYEQEDGEGGKEEDPDARELKIEGEQSGEQLEEDEGVATLK